MQIEKTREETDERGTTREYKLYDRKKFVGSLAFISMKNESVFIELTKKCGLSGYKYVWGDELKELIEELETGEISCETISEIKRGLSWCSGA